MKNERDFLFRCGLTLFGAAAGAILFFFILFRFSAISDFFGVLLSALQPLIWGIALAYLLMPVAKGLEKLLKKVPGVKKIARLLSALLTIVVAFVVLGVFCAMLLPQLVDSVSGLVQDLPGLVETQIKRLSSYLENNDEAAATVLQMITSAENYLVEWFKNNMLSTITSLASRVLSIGSMVINLVVAVIVSIYLLLDRERYLGQLRKLFYAVSHNRTFNTAVMEAAHQTNLIFSGFIRGKLVDSFIVGVICFVGLSLLKMPYTLVISVIVGVTNIIPMFGPFIGAVPSAFLLLLVSPAKCVIFLIFIILLQQVDGNILGPRILGNSTGLSALYVTVAMLIFGKLLGFLGMLIGVPLFATLYYLVKRLAEHSLRRQNLPTATEDYEDRGPDGDVIWNSPGVPEENSGVALHAEQEPETKV